ncbi:MAG: ABC transporter ATP-binding protein [Acidimicrobiia bacterium]|nr:ABC transporter ATP-binding protein [Acidimicrobiia bacterium]
MARLEVRDLTVRYGGHVAVDGVSLDAEAGRVTGLIGPNGAGKTTLFNVVSGLLPTQRGKIFLDGRDVTRMNPSRRARRGLARTFQRLELFSMLSVRDNVRVAVDSRRSWSRDPGTAADATEELMGRVGLTELADERVDALPTGQARLVELGRALATRPTVLLLDEPASGQDDQETRAFGGLLGEIAASGVAVVLVEHDVGLVMRACDHVYVLDFGRVIASGTPEEIRHDEAVLAAYLGTGVGVRT